MRRAALSFALLATAASACATTSKNAEREYVRGGLDEVRLQSIDVVLVAAGPPRAAGVSFDVKGFLPPAPDQVLAFSGPEEQATRRELKRVLGDRLRSEGYAVNLILRAEPPASSASSTASVPLYERPRLDTSTTATTAGLGAARAPIRDLAPNATLADVLKDSRADAVLVVRVVPVDSFFVDVGAGTRIQVTELGQERIRDVRPVPREGRLLAGQAFLFDRASGLRLWTKQLPDYPENGRLVPDHKFLQYGVLYPIDQPPPALPDDRAKPAAEGFVTAMFRDFPHPHEGSEAGRASLSSLDLREEQTRETFLDKGRLGLELGAAWSIEHAKLEGTLGTDPIPSLGTGAVAPGGVAKIVPRLVYMAPGGLVLGLALPIGYAPSNFSRSYERDNPTLSAADPNDRAATVAVSHSTTFGVQATVGPARFITNTILLVPNGGLFADVLSASVTPSTIVNSGTMTRIGALAGADLWLRVAEDSPLYGRIGGDLKIGIDLGGPLTYGLELAASLGLFL